MGRLRGVVPADADWLWAEAPAGERTRRWTARGGSLSPPVVNALLAEDVIAQAVAARPDGTPLALLQLGPGGGPGLAVLDLVVARGAGPQAGAVAAFLGAVEVRPPLRRLWAEVVDGDLDVGAHLPGAPLAARLREHERTGRDTYRDVLVHEVPLPGAGPP